MDWSITYSLSCCQLLTIVICILKELLTTVFPNLQAHSILKHKHIIFSSEIKPLWNFIFFFLRTKLKIKILLKRNVPRDETKMEILDKKNNASFITSKILFSITPYNEAFNEVFF